jgi:hypothetical protein
MGFFLGRARSVVSESGASVYCLVINLLPLCKDFFGGFGSPFLGDRALNRFYEERSVKRCHHLQVIDLVDFEADIGLPINLREVSITV